MYKIFLQQHLILFHQRIAFHLGYHLFIYICRLTLYLRMMHSKTERIWQWSRSTLKGWGLLTKCFQLTCFRLESQSDFFKTVVFSFPHNTRKSV